ncbi:putative butyrate kinase 2 [bioreactor metagenome]|uniref:Putative butyrate kinase 2 n=1 Tax=bioreactor metagenome TaxID=1076179 RepID=A0A644ZYK4_9ZZZZ
MAYSILVINTGSTSTKLAVYRDKEKAVQKEYSHSKEDLKKYHSIADQLPMRLNVAEKFVESEAAPYRPFDAVVARGGFLCPIKPGGYEVNEDMVYYSVHISKEEHASNLSACIANEFKKRYGIPAYIYDGLTSDELPPIARITGIPDLPKVSISHMLNMRATAKKAAADIRKDYSDCTFVILHMGGGVSLSLHHKGHVIETLADDDGPFSTERAGGQQAVRLIEYIEKLPSLRDKIKVIRGNGGLVAYFGTSDAREVEKMIAAGNEKALLVYQAMAYQITKSVAALASVNRGKLDGIIFTGGLAYSKMMGEFIKERAGYIAPVYIYPGENEMESLALGAYRILTGEETARIFEYQQKSGCECCVF